MPRHAPTTRQPDSPTVPDRSGAWVQLPSLPPQMRQIALVALNLRSLRALRLLRYRQPARVVAVGWLRWLRQIASAHVTASQHSLAYVEKGVSGVTQKSGFMSLSVTPRYRWCNPNQFFGRVKNALTNVRRFL